MEWCGGSQGTRMRCESVRRACSDTVAPRSSKGTIESELLTGAPWSAPKVVKMSRMGSVAVRDSMLEPFITADVRSDNSMRRMASIDTGGAGGGGEAPLPSSSVLLSMVDSSRSVYGGGGGRMSCVMAIMPGKCSSLSRTTVNRDFVSSILPALLPPILASLSSVTSGASALAKFAPVAEARTRISGGYRRTTAGVVMKVRTRASKTNMENTR